MNLDVIVLKKNTISGTGNGLCNGLLKTQMLLKISKTKLKKKTELLWSTDGTLRISV